MGSTTNGNAILANGMSSNGFADSTTGSYSESLNSPRDDFGQRYSSITACCSSDACVHPSTSFMTNKRLSSHTALLEHSSKSLGITFDGAKKRHYKYSIF